MQIDKNGLSIDSLENTVDFMEQELQNKFGDAFEVKPEGIIDNIAFSCGALNLVIQQQIVELARQFDPETASGKYQDALYERIGVSRLEAQKTTFVCKVQGAANLKCAAGSMTIRSKSDKNEFENISEFVIGEDGSALVDFRCVIDGAIEVKSSDEFEIVIAPDGVNSVAPADDIQFAIGRERESDDEFRIRFRNAKATNAKATRNAVFANLSKYVDNAAFLKLLDPNSDKDIPPGYIKIIAHHNTTDNIFAQAILDNVAIGPLFLGDTEVTVYDNQDNPRKIIFKKADEINIDITAELKIRSGYYTNTVFNKVKDSILKYIEERVFGLGSIIYATEFIIPILETEGVEAVQSIKVKRNDIDEEYNDNVSLTNEQVPIFATERIVLNEDE